MKKKGYKIALIVCLAGFIVLGGIAVRGYIVRRNAERKLAELAEETRVTPTMPPTEPPTQTPVPTNTSTPTPEPTATATPVPDALAGITIPEKNIDWDALHAENEHIYSWICIPDTNVDYPILQHPEDRSYYLTHNVDHSEGWPGCIYTQNVNTKDWTDPNTVIYGHNMSEATGFGGTMFNDLHKFEDNQFFDDHQYVFIYTPEGVNVYEIFAAYPFSNIDLMMCFDYSTPEAAQIYFDGIWTNRDMSSHFRDNVTLTGDSRIITLSTCIDGQPEMRYLVQAVLLNP